MGSSFVSDWLADVMDKIHEHGWVLQGVMEGSDTFHDDIITRVGWVYTIGLFCWDHPEFIMTGVPMDCSGPILNDLGNRVRNGERFEDGMILDNVLGDGYKVLLRAVDTDAGDWFNVGTRLLPTLTALQVVWPEKDGTFPERSTPHQPLMKKE